MFQWFGHIERIDEGRMSSKGKVATVEGNHGGGRPRFDWLDGVKKDLAVRKVRLQETTQLARERSVWRVLVKAGLY